jgi:exopolyphosphatase/guanosine-5'-triphosphate,3'-diphosphate pyrophosphatase
MKVMSDLIAALDVGTNSFHLVVAKPTSAGFEVVTREREVIRLGRGGGDMKEISGDAMERGIRSLVRMHEIAESHGATLRAVATSAVREAVNGGEFIKRARKEAGVDLEVVSGTEEARLIHLGVLNAVGVHDHVMLMCDIGGGSTEVVVGLDDEVMFARSFKVGAVRLTDRFFTHENLHPGAVSSCRQYIRSTFAVVAPEVRDLGFQVAAVSSGTAETVARLVVRDRSIEEPRSLNRFEFTSDEVRRVVARLVAAATIDERQEAFALERSRAEIILAGALVLECVGDVFGVGTFTYSDYALREGVLFDTLRRDGRIVVADDHDAARRSVLQLAERCDDRPDHSQHVARLAGELFDQLFSELRLTSDWRRYLEFAALLANVGVVVAHAKHHLHSYYVIRNSELVGLSDREIEIVAQIARYHRKSVPKESHPQFAALTTSDQYVVRSMAAILRVAIGLDRTQDGRVKSVSVTTDDEQITVAVRSRGKKRGELGLNIYAANERKELLAELSGRKVKFVEDEN